MQAVFTRDTCHFLNGLDVCLQTLASGHSCQGERSHKLRFFLHHFVTELRACTGPTDRQTDRRARPLMQPTGVVHNNLANLPQNWLPVQTVCSHAMQKKHQT